MSKNILKNLLGDIKVVEATADLLIRIKPVHVKRAKRHNAVSCILAVAANDTMSEKAIFLSKIAYLYMPDQHGEYRWVRYTIPAATDNLIYTFDHQGAKAITAQNATFVLNAPSPGRTLLAQRNYMRDWKPSQVGKKIKPVTPRQPFRGRRGTLQRIPMLVA